jgi:hypothetical protein
MGRDPRGVQIDRGNFTHCCVCQEPKTLSQCGFERTYTIIAAGWLGCLSRLAAPRVDQLPAPAPSQAYDDLSGNPLRAMRSCQGGLSHQHCLGAAYFLLWPAARQHSVTYLSERQ